ncbi:SIR2 family protein [Colwelliaceae bacterium 6441]
MNKKANEVSQNKLDFKISHQHISNLKRQNKLAIFVGSGVSMSCGLPSWTELAKNITKKIWHYKKPRPNQELINYIGSQTACDIARLARNEVGDELNRIIADSLYNHNEIVLNDTIFSIVNSGVQQICTLNYDDLLEEGFGYEMKRFQSVVGGESFNIHDPNPIIYHPHGYLPRWAEHHDYKKYKVVLSDADYSALYSNPLSWANTIQTSLMVSHSILFIGLSMTDPNINRLLELTKSIGCSHKHYAILPSPKLMFQDLKVRSYQYIQETMTTDLDAKNVKVHWVDEYKEIPNLLNKLFK